MQLETKLNNFIEELYQELLNSVPAGGFSSPRDLKLVTDVNKKSAVLRHLQDGMRVLNPDYQIGK